MQSKCSQKSVKNQSLRSFQSCYLSIFYYRYRDKRVKEKMENMPLAIDLLLDVWESYTMFRKKKELKELICHVVLTLSGIQSDFLSNEINVDRSDWIKLLCQMLDEELDSKDNNDQVLQSLTIALSIEMGQNFSLAWPKFAQICDKFVNNANVSLTRLYMIILLISCITNQPIEGRTNTRIFDGFLSKMQRVDFSNISIIKDLLIFFNFMVCSRQKPLQKLSLDDDILFNLIDVIFQLECHEYLKNDLNFRLTCLKTIQHLSPLTSDEKIRSNIIKHLFARLYQVKWVENLGELLVPPQSQAKLEKFEVSFNIERSILCHAETSQIVCHAQGGKGYCQARRGISGMLLCPAQSIL